MTGSFDYSAIDLTGRKFVPEVLRDPDDPTVTASPVAPQTYGPPR